MRTEPGERVAGTVLTSRRRYLQRGRRAGRPVRSSSRSREVARRVPATDRVILGTRDVAYAQRGQLRDPEVAPFVAWFDKDHFVVVEAVDHHDGRLIVQDPEQGRASGGALYYSDVEDQSHALRGCPHPGSDNCRHLDFLSLAIGPLRLDERALSVTPYCLPLLLPPVCPGAGGYLIRPARRA